MQVKARWRKTLLTVSVLLLLSISFSHAASQLPANILILHSYHPDSKWTRDVSFGMSEVFRKSKQQPQLQLEYLDARRYGTSEYLDTFRQLLQFKSKKKDFGLVLVSDNDALDFMLTHRDRLAPGVPIVFCGINNFEESLLRGQRGVTGVAEDASIGDTLNCALRLHPHTRDVVVIGRTSVAADRANCEAFLSSLSKLQGRANFTFWDDLSLPALRQRLQALQDGSMVFINGLTRDENGRELSYAEAAREIRAACGVPVYSLWEVYLGHGIVGGKLVSGRAQGKLAAELALRILGGEDPDQVPVIHRDMNEFMFDHDELERFGIGPQDLPPGSVVIHEPSLSYQLNRAYVWFGIAAILFLSMGVALLATSDRARKRVEKALRASQQRLELALTGAELGLWDWDIRSGTVIFNRRWAEMLGYSLDEIEPHVSSWEKLLHPNDALQVMETLNAHLQGATPFYETEHRLRTKTGDWKWVLDRGKVVEWSKNGEPLRAAGTHLDITAQKHATEELQQSEDKYRRLFELESDAIFLIENEAGRILEVNAAGLALYGYSREELLSMRNFDLSAQPSETRLATREQQKRVPVRYHRKKDGTVFPVEITASHFRWSGCETHLAAIRDISERLKAEAEIEEQQAFLSKILDTNPNLICVRDAQGRLIMANRAYIEFFGTSFEQLAGKTALETLPDAGIAASIYRDDMAVLRQELNRVQREEAYVDKAGNRRWMFTVKLPMKDRNGAVQQLIAVSTEITGRKLAEEALQRERDLLERIMATSPAGITLVDRKGRITFANTRAEQVLGLMKEHDGQGGYSLPEWKITDFDGNPLPSGELSLKSVMQSAQPVHNVRHAIQWPDKRRILLSVNAAPLINERGRLEGMVASVEDITEHVRAIAALRESEERYRLLFNEMVSAFALCDAIYDAGDRPRDHRFLEVNPAFEAFTGLKRSEILGKTLREVLPESEPDWIAICSEVVQTRIPARFESHHQAIGKYFEGIAFCPKPGHCALTFNDLSEQKRAEEEKQALQTQLLQAQKMEAIGRLAGGIAHDFNNLLMVIQGNASLMLLDLDPAHPHHEKLKHVEEYVQNGAELTKQLLGFARGGKFEVKPFDLNKLAMKTSSMFGRSKKEIRICAKYEQALWSVEGDRSQLEQVLLNLYVNAWQAMPGGGDLYLETRNMILEEDYVRPHGVEPGKFVRFTVTDTGVGMDETTRQRLFEPFFTTKEMGRGTGLGLASVYGIIKNHCGFIMVYSEQGQGTTFSIYLPASEKEVAETQIVQEEIVRGTETILFVDDEQVVIDVNAKLLEFLGHRVITARSGKEAVEIYRSLPGEIDLIILDMIMPGMDGGETFDQLQEINPGLKVILSSGYSINGQASEILSRGCSGFIQKPFNVKELSAKLREVLGREPG